MREDKNTPTRSVDWLVLGAGAGGLAAALAGAIRGFSVLVCEKSGWVGGTAATSAGTLWVPGNRESREAGWNHDSVESAARYLEALLPDAGAGRDVRSAFLEHAAAAIDWYAERSDVRFLPCGRHPDYLSLPDAAIEGRAIIPAPFDGRALRGNFRRVRPPIPEFLVCGGMMVGKANIPLLLDRWRSWKGFRHSAALMARHAADRLRYPRGTRLVMGNALVARLYASLLRRQVPIWFEAPLLDLCWEDGRVVGATLAGKPGSPPRRVTARRGVVLATGGIARNAELRGRLLAPPVPDSMAVPENTGDGIAAAAGRARVTAPGEHLSGAFWAPVSRTGGSGWAGLFPHLVMDRAKPGLIAVDRRGRRFANEADSYHHFAEAMLRLPAGGDGAPPAWLVCTAGFIERYGLGAIHPGTTRLAPYVRRGWLNVADSPAALAAQLGLDAGALRETVERYNAMALHGVDADFGKGESELNRFNGDPGHQPNPCMAPLDQGPFCAMGIWPAEIGCSAGLETDADARVLQPDGTPIAGLYACGNDMASVMRGTYPGPGTTLGPALVFAYLAARHAESVSPTAPGPRQSEAST